MYGSLQAFNQDHQLAAKSFWVLGEQTWQISLEYCFLGSRGPKKASTSEMVSHVI